LPVLLARRTFMIALETNDHPRASGSAASFVRRNGSYGIDAPYLLLVPATLALLNLFNGLRSGAVIPLIAAALIVACMGLGWHASQRGKFVVWSELLDQLDLRGDERILDLGCGRGAVLLLAAQRLTTGRAVGVDLWRRADQSGASLAATERNAAAEGVSGRVELHTADMTALPFDDSSFDVVLSNIAIHNVKGVAGRHQVIDEAARVLRPGGRLLLADLAGASQYVARLTELGFVNVERRSLGWRMWWSGPWLATRLVSATKRDE